MPHVKFHRNCVVQNESTCFFILICLLYMSYCITAMVATFTHYQHHLQTFAVCVYLPIIFSTTVVITYYLRLICTDPGFMPVRCERSCQLPEIKDQILFDSLDYSTTVYFNSQLQIKEMCQHHKNSTSFRQKCNKNKQNAKDIYKAGEETQELVEKDQIENKPATDLYNQRRCYTCKINKIIGLAHCSKCNKCVVLMDHHCPFNGTCIGVRNQYLFIITLAVTLFHVIISIIYNSVGLGLSVKLYVKDKSLYVQLYYHIALVVTMQVWSIVWAFLGAIFTIVMLYQQNQLLKNGLTTRLVYRNQQNLKQLISDLLRHNTQENRQNYVNWLVNSDKLLNTLYSKMRLVKTSAKRRLKYGKHMPALHNMHPLEAEQVAWRWTVLLSCYDIE